MGQAGAQGLSESPGSRGAWDRGLGGTRWPGLPAFSGDSARSLAPAAGRTDGVATARSGLTRRAICAARSGARQGGWCPLRARPSWPRRADLPRSLRTPACGTLCIPFTFTCLGFEFSSEMGFCSFLCVLFTVFRSFQKKRPGTSCGQV